MSLDCDFCFLFSLCSHDLSLFSCSAGLTLLDKTDLGASILPLRGTGEQLFTILLLLCLTEFGSIDIAYTQMFDYWLLATKIVILLAVYNLSC